MGNVVKARCGQCGYGHEMYLGGGLRDCHMETILRALPPAGRALLEREKNKITSLSIDRRAALCPDCQEWFALPVVKCVLKTETILLYGVCPKCRKPGTNCLADVSDEVCPKCGAPLTLSEIGHWD